MIRNSSVQKMKLLSKVLTVAALTPLQGAIGTNVVQVTYAWGPEFVLVVSIADIIV